MNCLFLTVVFTLMSQLTAHAWAYLPAPCLKADPPPPPAFDCPVPYLELIPKYEDRLFERAWYCPEIDHSLGLLRGGGCGGSQGLAMFDDWTHPNVKRDATLQPVQPETDPTDHPRYVPWDALQVKECYLTNAPELHMQRDRTILKLGAYILYRGSVICVDEMDRSGGELWYKVRVKELETLNGRDWPGWINSEDLKEHGVRLSY